MAKKPNSFGSGAVKKMAGGGGAQSGQRAERGGGSANSVGASRSSSSSAGNKGSSTGSKGSSVASKSTAAAAKSVASTTSVRPAAKPAVAVIGSGKNTAYLDTKTGVKYAAPSYSALSLKGLTSTDPANVARNRAGVAALNRVDAQREMGAGRGEGPAAIAATKAAPVATAPVEAAAPKVVPRVYTPPPAGYRPGIDPEWNYSQAAPAAMKRGGKVKPKGKK